MAVAEGWIGIYHLVVTTAEIEDLKLDLPITSSLGKVRPRRASTEAARRWLGLQQSAGR
jgi:hypothetical protein